MSPWSWSCYPIMTQACCTKTTRMEPKGCRKLLSWSRMGAKWSQKGCQKLLKLSKMGTKMNRGTSQNTPLGTGTKNVEKGRYYPLFRGALFARKSTNIPSTKISKKSIAKKHETITNGNQHGIKIDAKTHRNSVRKLGAKKMRKIMNNHVFLICKIM